MLSARRRDEQRKGRMLGFVGMEGNELEEGEACSTQEEEDDSCVDPDIALSYIDEKLQDVLGHIRIEFEGGVSAENLGAKFGGYGSFLPTYQRSPSILSQPKSPPRAPNHNATRSPYAPSFEGTRQNPSIEIGSSVSKNNTALAPPLDNTSKRGMGMSTYNNEPLPQHDSLNKPVNSSDQKTLKVRIKVGPDNILARNNAAIYTGLGLDVSPSSSLEDSPDGSGGPSLQFQHVPDESPRTILQVMTFSPVPGHILLSPLQDSLYQLTEKDSSFIKNCNTGMSYGGTLDKSVVLGDLTLPVKDVKEYNERKMKSNEKKGKSMEEKNLKYKNDISTNWNREIDIGNPAGQKLVSDALNIPMLSGLKDADTKTEGQIVKDSVKDATRISDHSKELKMITMKERIPSPDFVKDRQLESMESMENNGVDNLGNEATHSKRKLNPKKMMAEKTLEERNTSCHKGTLFDLQREDRSKVEKSYDLVNADSNIFKERKEHTAGPLNHIKHISSQKVTSCEPEGEKIFQGKDQLFECEKKLKGSQTIAAPVVELDNLSGQSSASLKEKKRRSHAKYNHAEKKSKVLKSCKESSKVSFKESCSDVNQEQLESGTGLPDFRYKDKLQVLNYEHEKEPFTSTGTSKMRSGGKKVNNPLISDASVNESATMPLMVNAPASGAAPVVIKEHWVCCDICQQWRLLPYGTNPDHLPANWQCSMLSWLPGMNSCKFSEEQTTNALNALYLIPVPESGASFEGCHNVAASNITSANALHHNQKLEHNMGSLPAIRKRKNGPKDASNVLNHSAQFSNPVKRNQQAPNKSKSLNDVNQSPFEIDKAGLSHASKSTDFSAKKQKHKRKEKHENLGCYSNGGDFVERSEKHSKPKNKREVDQNNFSTCKKIKKEGSSYHVKNCYSDHDVAGKAGPDMANGLSTKVVAKDLQKQSGVSLSKDLKCETKDSLSALSKRLKDEVQFLPNGEIKAQFNASDVEKSEKLDFAAKKRKLKEWQDDLHNQEAHATVNEILSETEMLNNARVSKSGGKWSSTGRMDKKGSSSGVVLPGSRVHLPDGMDEEGRYVIGKEHQLGLCQGNATSRQVLDFGDPLKRDITYAQVSTTPTSSSSKLSSSHKSKANFQETKGSPVESVSSSPLRFLNTEKLSNKTNSLVKDDALNVGSSVPRSPKRCSDSEADGGTGPSGKGRKETVCSAEKRHIENHRAAESGVSNPVRGSFVRQDREGNLLSFGKAEDGMHLKSISHNGLSPTKFEVINVMNGTRNFMVQHHKNPHEHLSKDHIQDLDKLNKQHQVNGSGQQRKSGKNSSSQFKERHRSSKSDLDVGKLKVSGSSSENRDSYSMKSGSGSQQNVDLDSRHHSTDLENLRDRSCNFQKDEKNFLGKKGLATRCSPGRRDDGVQENLDTHCPSVLPNQHNVLEPRVAVAGARCSKSNLWDDLQSVSSYNDEKSNLVDQRELPAGTGKTHLILSNGDKQQTHSRGLQHSSPVKGSRSELPSNDAVDTCALKAGKNSRQPDIQNEVHHHSFGQATPNGPDTSSPIQKDSHSTASIVMKEARDLKHTADRLKSEGLELESTGLFFQAALKFLHYASLMEPLSFDSAKQGDTSRSMQIYFDTAKLCKFCAHGYERCKEMAAAALAYKCVEVAYFKSAYYKYPSATKDQHELQTALQILQPGESPSSSSSDIDNLNNQGTLVKATSAHVAGTHVISARNHPHVMRLLSYINDLNSAFEAARKSQIAIAAASVGLDKDKADGMSSVRKVLDFNFHNVEGLLRLVRLAMESIGR